MNKSELLKQFDQARVPVDYIIGCTIILGLLGCFSKFQSVKLFSLSILIGSVGTLISNMMIISLYAEAILKVLEKNRIWYRHLLSLSEEEVSNLNVQISKWQEFGQQKHKEVELLKLKILQAQQAVVDAQAQITEGNYQRDLLQIKIEALKEQIYWLNKI